MIIIINFLYIRMTLWFYWSALGLWAVPHASLLWKLEITKGYRLLNSTAQKFFKKKSDLCLNVEIDLQKSGCALSVGEGCFTCLSLMFLHVFPPLKAFEVVFPPPSRRSRAEDVAPWRWSSPLRNCDWLLYKYIFWLMDTVPFATGKLVLTIKPENPQKSQNFQTKTDSCNYVSLTRIWQ